MTKKQSAGANIPSAGSYTQALTHIAVTTTQIVAGRRIPTTGFKRTGVPPGSEVSACRFILGFRRR